MRDAQRPEELREGVLANLTSLALDQVPVMNLRRHAESDVPFDEQVAAMVALRDEGLIGAIGLSNVTLEQYQAARKVIRRISLATTCDVAAIPTEKGRKARPALSGLYPSAVCRYRVEPAGGGLMTRAPLRRGPREDRAPAGGHARSHPSIACLMTTSRSAPVTERECPQMPQNGRSSGHAQ